MTDKSPYEIYVDGNEEEEENSSKGKKNKNNNIKNNKKIQTYIKGKSPKNKEKSSEKEKIKLKENNSEKNSNYYKRENNILNQNHIKRTIIDTNKNDKGEDINNENDEQENESEKEDEINNDEDNNNNIEDDIKDNNDDEKDKEEKEEIKIEIYKNQNIRQLKENIKSIYTKTQSKSGRLKELLNKLKNDIQLNNTKKQTYASRLSDINKETKSELKLKKNIIIDMKNLEDLIIEKLDKIDEFRRLKLKRGHNSVERCNKKLFIYNNSEDIIKIKQKQLKNVVKLNNIVDKDISNLYTNLKRGYYIDQDIQEEKPKITTKKEELFYTYSKISVDVSKLKNEVQLLRHIKDVHNNCDRTIFRLNKELEVLREKKDRKIYYIDFLANNKELNDIKRKQIIANKGLDNYKYRYALKKDNDRYKTMRTISQSKFSVSGMRNKIQLVIPKEKSMNNLLSSNYNDNDNNDMSLSDSYNNDDNENNIDNNDNNESIDNQNDEETKTKYKNLLQTKIEEKNVLQRKYYSVMKELEQEIIQKEAELKGKESKKKNLLKSNYNLQNTQKFNEEKIRKLKKQLNELKIEVSNYDEQLSQKDGVLDELKKAMNDAKKF